MQNTQRTWKDVLGGRVDIHDVRLLDAELQETSSDLNGSVLDLLEGEVLVVAELKVLPSLLLRGLFATDDLLDLLLLLVDVDDLPVAVCVLRAVRTRGVHENVVDGVDALPWLRDELVR